VCVKARYNARGSMLESVELIVLCRIVSFFLQFQKKPVFFFFFINIPFFSLNLAELTFPVAYISCVLLS